MYKFNECITEKINKGLNEMNNLKNEWNKWDGWNKWKE